MSKLDKLIQKILRRPPAVRYRDESVHSSTQSRHSFLSRKYPMTLCPEEDGGYTALVPDLKGCMSQGETLEEALQNIDEARQVWIETAFDFNDEIPAPSTKQAWIQ